MFTRFFLSLLSIVTGILISAFVLADLDPKYIEAFGYGSICVSNSGFPQKAFYNPGQFDFRDGKFFVDAGGTINLRAMLPRGKTYNDLLQSFNKTHKDFAKMTEEQVYWKIYSSHDPVGNVLFAKWPADASKMLHENKPLCFIQFKTPSDLRSWNSSGVNWDDTENNDLQRDVGMWLSNAQPGWQLYILHTVGFRRDCPEDKYWDIAQGKEIIPTAFEMAAPFAFCIVEVK